MTDRPLSVNGYDFDINRMTSFEGDTGPYLQYAHARLCSIARKAELTPEELASADFSLLTEKHAVEVVRSLARWAVTRASPVSTPPGVSCPLSCWASGRPCSGRTRVS